MTHRQDKQAAYLRDGIWTSFSVSAFSHLAHVIRNSISYALPEAWRVTSTTRMLHAVDRGMENAYAASRHPENHCQQKPKTT